MAPSMTSGGMVCPPSWSFCRPSTTTTSSAVMPSLITMPAPPRGPGFTTFWCALPCASTVHSVAAAVW